MIEMECRIKNIESRILKTAFFMLNTRTLKLLLSTSILILWVAISAPAFSADLDPQKILEEVDDNLWSSTKYIYGRLIIDNGRKVRILKWEHWMEGVERAFTNYLSPPREKGIKMLKIADKLWMYTPRTDRKILIAGHLLRQSMMGSDLSYEDMMEDKKLSAAYTATFMAQEELRGKECCVLHLVAHDKTTTYQTRKLWVDVDRKIVFREELYAKGGKLLKSVEYLEYRPIGKRLFPRKMIFRDLLKENTKTTYIFDKIEFDIKIPKKYFSQSILKR
jgi:outer membrane lipoprotein-sorting protein